MPLIDEITSHSTQLRDTINDNIGYFFSLIVICFIFLAPNEIPKEVNNKIGLWLPMLSKGLLFYGWAIMILLWTNRILNNETGSPRLGSILKSQPRLIILTIQIYILFSAIKLLPFLFRDAVSMNNIYQEVYTNQIISMIAYIACVFLIVRSSFKFIARSHGIKVSFMESFKRTSMQESKIILSAFYVALPYLVILIIYPFAVSMLGVLFPILSEDPLGKVTWLIMMAPKEFILSPLVTTIFLLSFIIAYKEQTASTTISPHPIVAQEKTETTDELIDKTEENSTQKKTVSKDFFEL